MVKMAKSIHQSLISGKRTRHGAPQRGHSEGQAGWGGVPRSFQLEEAAASQEVTEHH